MIRTLFITTTILMAGLSGFSQSGSPSYGKIKIGAPMPDFVLTHIEHFRTSSASLNEFKGRWLVLDFWHEYCSGCIAAFPKIMHSKVG
jgi:thiol-disulfide isomerase/thioredoxin